MVLRGDQFVNTFWEEGGETRTSSIDPESGRPTEAPEGTTLQGTLFSPYVGTGLPQDPTPGAAEHRRRVIADRFPTEPISPVHKIIGGAIQQQGTTKGSRASGTDWRDPDPRFSELVTSHLSGTEMPTHIASQVPRTTALEGAPLNAAGSYGRVPPEGITAIVGELSDTSRESQAFRHQMGATDEDVEALLEHTEGTDPTGFLTLGTEVTKPAKTAKQQRQEAESRGEGPASGETVWNKNWLKDKPQVLDDEPTYAYDTWEKLHEHGVFRNPDTGQEISGYEAIVEATGYDIGGDSTNYNYQLSDLYNLGYTESNIHWKNKGATGVASAPIVGKVEVPGDGYVEDEDTGRWRHPDTGIPFQESVKFHTRTSGDPNWGDFEDKPEELGLESADVIDHEIGHALDRGQRESTRKTTVTRNPISEGLADAREDLHSRFKGIHESAAVLDPAHPRRVSQLQHGGYGTAHIGEDSRGNETRSSLWGTKTEEAAYAAARIIQSSTDDPDILRQVSPDNWEASDTEGLSKFVADAHSANPGVRRGLHALGYGRLANQAVNAQEEVVQASNLLPSAAELPYQGDSGEQLPLPDMPAPTDHRMTSAQWAQTGFPSEEDAEKFGGSAEEPPTPVNTKPKPKPKKDPNKEMKLGQFLRF